MVCNFHPPHRVVYVAPLRPETFSNEPWNEALCSVKQNKNSSKFLIGGSDGWSVEDIILWTISSTAPSFSKTPCRSVLPFETVAAYFRVRGRKQVYTTAVPRKSTVSLEHDARRIQYSSTGKLPVADLTVIGRKDPGDKWLYVEHVEHNILHAMHTLTEKLRSSKFTNGRPCFLFSNGINKPPSVMQCTSK